jgi:peptide/nickel transport system substrate-binding protein
MDGTGYLHTRKDKGRKKRKMAKKLFSLLMALTLLAALALPAAFAEDYLDIINIADDNQSASYDLHKDTSVNGRNMLRGTVMEQLVTLKADGSIAPELCESYDVSDDNSAFTFHLRKGVKFHNGKEMTSADVVASLNRWLECFGTARKMVGDARFTVVDDYTVSLTLDHSAIMLLDMLAGAAQAAVIYPVESIEAVNADTGYVPADYIIGTGPYMFKEWAVDQYVLLERFDDYAAYGDPEQPIDGLWGYKHAYTKTLKYWIVKDAATRFNGLMSGEYDFIVKATDAYLGTLRSMPDITCYSMQTGMINLVWNKHSTDKYLRLAFQALANADDLNTANYGSLYDNDPCFMEKSQPGWYTTKGEEFFCQNDPEKAKELLAQSSFDTSKPLRILTATGGGAEAMLEVLRQEAAKIGVTLEITATDRTTMTSMRNDETLYDAYFTTFSSVAVPSLRNFLSADYAGWSDDEHLQELMLQMTTAATKEAAFATWEEIQYYCYSDYCPILMMGHFHQAAACTNRLTGYNVFLTTNFWNAKLAK